MSCHSWWCDGRADLLKGRLVVICLRFLVDQNQPQLGEEIDHFALIHYKVDQKLVEKHS